MPERPSAGSRAPRPRRAARPAVPSQARGPADDHAGNAPRAPAGEEKTPAAETPRAGRALIGTSGYDYPRWKGSFYPDALPRSRWLAWCAGRFDSVEINGTFYSLKSPATFRRWAGATPEGFVLALKGSRYVTHNLKLKNAELALANFFASGVLALGRRTGPFLWQLPSSHHFDAPRVEGFLRQLPRGSVEAEALARGHDDRLRHGALCEAADDVPYRHAIEARHESWFGEEAAALLRAFDTALVVSDAPGWARSERVTAGFAYVRLHGARQLYANAYEEEELAGWAERVHDWCAAGLDVYVYFDNDAQAHAPQDARRLRERVAALAGADTGQPVR